MAKRKPLETLLELMDCAFAEFEKVSEERGYNMADDDVVYAWKLALLAAEKAAPYCHPKLAAVIYKDAGAPLEDLSNDDLLRIIFGKEAASVGAAPAASDGSGKLVRMEQAARLMARKASSRRH